MSWRDTLKTNMKPRDHKSHNPHNFNSGDYGNIGVGISGLVSAHDENRIRAWLAHIGETCPVTIREVLAKCRTEPEDLAYYLKRAGEVPDQATQAMPISVRCGDCRHFKRIEHPNLGHCTQGGPEAPAGLWDADTRGCEAYQPRLET